jgi:hypothetical protein
LSILCLGAGVLPEKIQKVRFCPTEKRDLNRSEVSTSATFLAKLSNKETYLKVVVRVGLINLIACPIGDVLTPLNFCKVLIGNSYKVLPGKYKTPILKNVCPS